MKEVREGEQQVHIAAALQQTLLEVLEGHVRFATLQCVPGPGEPRPLERFAAPGLLVAKRQDPVLPEAVQLRHGGRQGRALGKLHSLGRLRWLRQHNAFEVGHRALTAAAARRVHELAECLAVEEAPVGLVLHVVEEIDDPPGRRVPGRSPRVAVFQDDPPGGRRLRRDGPVSRLQAVRRGIHPAALHPDGQGQQAVVGGQVHDDRPVGQDPRALEEGRQALVQPARSPGRQAHELVRGLVEQCRHGLLEAARPDVGFDGAAGEVAPRPLDRGPDAQGQVLVAGGEDVQVDPRHGAAVLLGAVLEELAIEAVHLLHRLGSAHQNFVAGVRVGDVVTADVLRAVVPGVVGSVEFGDPLRRDVGQEVLRLGVRRQAGVGRRGDPLDGLLAFHAARIQRQDLAVDPYRGVRTPVLLVAVRQRLQAPRELVLQPEQFGGQRVDAPDPDLEPGEHLGGRALGPPQTQFPVKRPDLFVRVPGRLRPPCPQRPGIRRVGIALQR